MARQNIHQWCKQNNWTEPRRLPNGLWVAFPPGGVIETPLPQFSSPTAEVEIQTSDIVYGLVLVLAALVISAIILLLSPIFLLKSINQSLSKNLS